MKTERDIFIFEIIRARPDLEKFVLWLFKEHKLENTYTVCEALDLLQNYISIEVNEAINAEFDNSKSVFVKNSESDKE